MRILLSFCCGLDQDIKCCQGLEEIITFFRIHGLDQLWLGSLGFGSRGESRQGWPLCGTLFSVVVWIKTWNVVKGLRKLLHPSEFMVWINCGLDHCGLDQGVKVVKKGPLRGTLSSFVVWVKTWNIGDCDSVSVWRLGQVHEVAMQLFSYLFSRLNCSIKYW